MLTMILIMIHEISYMDADEGIDAIEGYICVLTIFLDIFIFAWFLG